MSIPITPTKVLSLFYGSVSFQARFFYLLLVDMVLPYEGVVVSREKLAKVSGVPVSTLDRLLKMLTEAELITVTRQGKRKPNIIYIHQVVIPETESDFVLDESFEFPDVKLWGLLNGDSVSWPNRPCFRGDRRSKVAGCDGVSETCQNNKEGVNEPPTENAIEPVASSEPDSDGALTYPAKPDMSSAVDVETMPVDSDTPVSNSSSRVSLLEQKQNARKDSVLSGTISPQQTARQCASIYSLLTGSDSAEVGRSDAGGGDGGGNGRGKRKAAQVYPGNPTRGSYLMDLFRKKFTELFGALPFKPSMREYSQLAVLNRSYPEALNRDAITWLFDNWTEFSRKYRITTPLPTIGILVGFREALYAEVHAEKMPQKEPESQEYNYDRFMEEWNSIGVK